MIDAMTVDPTRLCKAEMKPETISAEARELLECYSRVPPGRIEDLVLSVVCR
jgi:hypothetical protein